MDTIMTPDGPTYIWDTQKDFTDLCRKYISESAALYIDEVLSDVRFEHEMAEKKYLSDFDALEVEVEEYRNELFDLKEQLEHISYEADQKPGLSKKKILEKIDQMWSHLQKIL